MATANIFVDANVLMELLFRRANYHTAAQVIAELPVSAITTTSVLALSILLYYVEAEGFDKATAHKFMAGYRILDMNDSDYVWARTNDQGDFEDALQVGCARRHDCTKLLTLDQKLEQMYGKFITVQTIG